MSCIKFGSAYEDIISVKNLLEAWQEFIRGKKGRKDVQEFQRSLMSNIILLHQELTDKTYIHSEYEAFNISDPKPRNIHKASVRDRLLHHALYRKLYPYFDKKFIVDSYSCRLGKGTHKALMRFKVFVGKVSKNYTRTVWVLKCDIRKFFASVDHKILIEILERSILDRNSIWLLKQIIKSFSATSATSANESSDLLCTGIGLPLGNLTSQLLVNIYMNEFDQYVKHVLRQKYYIRYADDFVFMDSDRKNLDLILLKIDDFLSNNLKLKLHPNKVFIKTVASGIDFLGWVHFEKHRVMRTTTRRRMFNRLKVNQNKETVASYKGLLRHGNAYKVEREVDSLIQDNLSLI